MKTAWQIGMMSLAAILGSAAITLIASENRFNSKLLFSFLFVSHLPVVVRLGQVVLSEDDRPKTQVRQQPVVSPGQPRRDNVVQLPKSEQNNSVPDFSGMIG